MKYEESAIEDEGFKFEQHPFHPFAFRLPPCFSFFILYTYLATPRGFSASKRGSRTGNFTKRAFC